jgi:MFS family permease
VTSFIVAALVAISLTIFVNMLQPYVLTENLRLPSSTHGRISSALVMQEAIALLLVGFLGAWSDRVGRRSVFAGGMLVVSCGLLLYPLCTTLPQLVASRVIVALGAACTAATLAGIAADLPRNDSRGRLLSILMFTQQVGIIVLVANAGAKLPQFLRSLGFDAVEAGRAAFWVVGFVGLLGGLVAFRGLRPPQHRESGATARSAGFAGVVADLRQVFREARRNPRLALVFPVAIVARGDAMIVSAFLSLWIVTAARAQGVATADALARAGTVLGVFTASAVVATIASGFLIDRMDRARAATWTVGTAGLAYVGSALVGDVMGPGMLLLAVAVGLTEAALIIAGQALLGEQASEERRGATVGTFGFCGSLGVLGITLVAGQLFDRWTHAGPFILVGAVNLAVFAWAWMIRRRLAPPAGGGPG